MPVLQKPATTFSKVLVASDFSPESERALAFAKALVRRSHGTLLLLHVTPWQPLPTSSEWSKASDNAAWRKGESQTAALAESLRREGFQVKSHCETGAVGQQVAQTALTEQAELIIAGTHAREGVERLLLGSVAEEIAGLAEIPLLLIGPKACPPQGKTWVPNHVLCCVASDANQEPLVEFACSLAEQNHAELSVAVFGRADCNRRWAQLRAHFQETSTRGESARLPEHAFCISSATPEMLVALALAKGADLILMGGRRAEWLSLRPGMLQHVLTEAPCPVLTIHTQP